MTVAAVHVPITTVPETVALIRQADDLGVRAVWLTSGGYGPECLTTLAVVGAQTRRVLIGSAVIVTASRHPLITAQQSLALADVAPGRFRLGIGTGHRSTVEGVFGLPFERPLHELREYLGVVRQAFEGDVDFDGQRFQVHGRLARRHTVPLYISALRPAAYRLAGELADGAISWVTPSGFLRDVAGPALRSAADAFDRPHPRLVGHVMGLVTDERDAPNRVARERLAANTRMPFYQSLFADCGFPEARDGVVPAGLVGEVAFVGAEERLADGFHRFIDAGCDEVIVSLLPGPAEDITRTLRVLATLSTA
jgi:F420-dependent oxidoreductase-like protein